MSSYPDIWLWTVVWLVAAAFTVYRNWRAGHGVGLVLGYVASFAALHWMSTLLYLVPWFHGTQRAWVAEGMRLSAIAMVALAVGAEFATWFGRRRTAHAPAVAVDDDEPAEEGSPDEDADELPTIAPSVINAYLIVGFVLQVFVGPIARGIPGMSAIAGTGSAFIVTGVGLKCWNAWQEGRPSTVWFWLAGTLTLPLLTVTTQGYLGYGMAALMTIFAFVVAFYEPRWKVAVVSLLLAYIGLSVYVTYMRDRLEIRELVWGGSRMSDRTDRVLGTLSEVEWFDPYNPRHLDRIDVRLNQNLLVGAAVKHVGEGVVPFASGATVYDAVLSVIPRALWPNKPMSAGSGDLVSIYTGLKFMGETSVGVGHVLEWYVNFGMRGIVGGFVLMGILIATFDRSAAAALHRGDPVRFALWYLPGLSLLNLGGSFVESTASAAASLLMALMVSRLVGYMPGAVRITTPRLSSAEPGDSEARF